MVIDTANMSRLKLLLVDDDMVDRRVIAHCIAKSGLTADLDEVSAVDEVRKRIKSRVYDCVLLDFHLADGDAFDLFGDLLAESCAERSSIVLLTGRGDEQIAAEAIQRGAQEYLSKLALNPQTIRRTIESAMVKAELNLQLKRRDDDLHRMSFYDTLTQLPNRHLFLDRLSQELRSAERENSQFAVFIMDLNGFKRVNDSHGHAAGDELLALVAARLRETVRESDTIARFGGDEFAVLLPGAADAPAAAEKIRMAFTHPFSLDEHVVNVGISIGIGLYPKHGKTANALLRHADLAMYQAKGSQRPLTYNTKYADQSDDGSTILRDLPHILKDNQLVPMYQPQVRLDTRAIVAVETFVRWEHPQLGLVPPMKFIPAAERLSIIEALTLHTLRTTLQQICDWQERAIEVDVALNLSASVIDRRGIVEQIVECITLFGVDPSALCFEVTETGIMRSPTHAKETLQALSALGCRISIDDFGTGYSSLKYLRDFPIDEIKIDRLFVAGLTGEKRDQVIVESVLGLGKSFGVRVVAEGIEDEATCKKLMALGCQFGQGFHFGRPMDAVQFELLYNNQPRRSPIVDAGEFRVQRIPAKPLRNVWSKGDGRSPELPQVRPK